MIDIKRLRNSFEEVENSLKRRNEDLSQLHDALKLDEEMRRLTSDRDSLRQEIKNISKNVGELHKNGDKEAAAELSQKSRDLKTTETELDGRVDELEEKFRYIMLRIPNEISSEVPDGKTDADNPVVQAPKERSWADHNRVPHWEIGEELSILDPTRAVKLSGSMFEMMRGPGAALARALCQYALDNVCDQWEEIRPPTLVSTETMTATGHLPKDEINMYSVPIDGLWAIPTAEVPLTSMMRDEILEEANLPLKLTAHTSCFRRESGAAGRDTRGLLRVHEFDKVEMMAYCTPEQGPGILNEILTNSVAIFEGLNLQIRVIEICSGDLGGPHHRSFDVEGYSPGTDMWLELASCSWFTDYQARRANVRFRTSAQSQNQLVHTCNGTALAVPRALAVLLETHRQADGSVALPEVLWPYMRGMRSISKKV